jgi:hypothetical protein
MEHTKPRYPLAEAFKLLGLSRSKGYLRVRDGQLNVTYDGDTPYVTSEEIDRYAALPHPKVNYAPARSQQRSAA